MATRVRPPHPHTHRHDTDGLVFDLINVATIHNTSIPSSALLTNSTLERLYTLASAHEWGLAQNTSDPVRGIAGAILAGQIVDALSAVVASPTTSPQLNIQFGAYGTFMSFFGLAGLPGASAAFTGICEYASSMAFELLRTDGDEVAVRFLFANGTAAENELAAFPLFGQDQVVLPWEEFRSGMLGFAVHDTQHWCEMCGNVDGECAVEGQDVGGEKECGDAGVSRPVAGVIGALVTLVVVLVVQAAVMVFGGLRLVRKKTLQGAAQVSSGEK